MEYLLRIQWTSTIITFHSCMYILCRRYRDWSELIKTIFPSCKFLWKSWIFPIRFWTERSWNIPFSRGNINNWFFFIHWVHLPHTELLGKGLMAFFIDFLLYYYYNIHLPHCLFLQQFKIWVFHLWEVPTIVGQILC